MMTELLREAIAIPALFGGYPIQSVNGSTGAGVIGTIDMRLYNRGQFLVGIGAGTCNVYLQQTANVLGVGASNLPMNPTNAQAMTPNTFATLEVRSDELTARYLTCQIITDGPAQVFAVGLGHEGRYDPANARDNTYVAGRLACTL